MHKLFIRTRGRAYRPPVATELPDSNKLLISFSQWNEFPREHDSYFRTEEIGIALCVQEQIIIRIFERRLRRLAIDSSSSSQFLDAKESNGSFFLSFFFLKMKWYSIFISKIGVQERIRLKTIEKKYSKKYLFENHEFTWTENFFGDSWCKNSRRAREIRSALSGFRRHRCLEEETRRSSFQFV